MQVFAAERFTEKLNFPQFQKKILQKNLDLKIEKQLSEGASAKSIGLQIPAPMIGFTQMKDTMGTTANGYEITQSIPFFTKLSSDYQARSEEAQSQKENLLARTNEISAEARLAYVGLWITQEKQNILIEKKQVLAEHVKLTRSTVRSDGFAGIHLLKAETDLDLIENEMISVKQELKDQLVKIALLLNEDPTNFDVLLEEPTLAPQPNTVEVEKSHQLQSMKWSLESFKSKETYAKSTWLPDFNLRYKQQAAVGATAGYNELMIGVSLPFVFFWEPYAESSQAISNRLGAELNFEKQKRNFMAQKTLLENKIQSLRAQMITLNEKVIPKAEKRVRLVHNVAPRDLEALQDHRETMEALPDFKMKALLLRLDYENAVAELNKFAVTSGDKNHE